MLAARHGLKERKGVSPEGLPERYLYSPDMAYRYGFGRRWGDEDLAITDVWVLLNPATGDTEQRRRPTLERCIYRNRDAGRSGLVIVNLFAHRHTDSKTLQQVADPVGPANDDALRRLTTAATRTIVAWGARAVSTAGPEPSLRCSTGRSAWARLGTASRATRCTWPRTRHSSRGSRPPLDLE